MTMVGAFGAWIGDRISRLRAERRKRAPLSSWDTGLSVVYVTRRAEPRFDWFADSLASQLGGEESLEVVFVDGFHSAGRSAALAGIVRGRFPYRHVPPKPSPLSGPYRLTAREYFAAASARNTGIVYARHPYVVFVDDVSVLLPGWWKEVRRAARLRYVVAGAYQKHFEMTVEDGLLVASRSEPAGIDSRWALGDSGGLVPIPGGQLYGSSVGVPRDALLAVNGFDELCDSAGGEDYQLGVRLEWAGEAIYYSRAMLTVESEELHRQGAALGGIDRTLDEAAYMSLLRTFGVGRRTTDGPREMGFMVLDILYGTHSVRSLGNSYSLAELREEDLPGLVERFPRRHWFTGEALSDL